MRLGFSADVQVFVFVSAAGPFDNPDSFPGFDLSNYGGFDYLDGKAGITISRGRSDEFTAFQSGTCTFTLRNDNREFDPTNASSPFIDILRPLRHVQVALAYAGNLYSL